MQQWEGETKGKGVVSKDAENEWEWRKLKILDKVGKFIHELEKDPQLALIFNEEFNKSPLYQNLIPECSNPNNLEVLKKVDQLKRDIFAHMLMQEYW